MGRRAEWPAIFWNYFFEKKSGAAILAARKNAGSNFAAENVLGAQDGTRPREFLKLFLIKFLERYLISRETANLLERHALGGIHLRVGFSAAGIFGLIGLMADGLKLFSIQIILPRAARSIFLWFAREGLNLGRIRAAIWISKNSRASFRAAPRYGGGQVYFFRNIFYGAK